MTHTPRPTLLSGVGGFKGHAPSAADPEKKMRHAPVGFWLASSSLRLTALLSYTRIATAVTKGPCRETSAGCQRPCTSRSVPTRTLCFSTQIVIVTRTSNKLLKIGPSGHVAPRGEDRKGGPNFRFHRKLIHGGSAGRRRRRCAARARYHRESHPSFCFTATRAWGLRSLGLLEATW